MTTAGGALGDQAGPSAAGRAGCHVVAAILKEFLPQPVAEQARLKSRLEALVAFGLQKLSSAQRIVLETPEGLVIVVLTGAADALEIAERVQAGAADLPLCMAVNYGPVRAGADGGPSPRFVGDGILSALTLANLATRGRLLVSRSFRDSLAAAEPHRAKALVSVGALTDATVRTHEIFTPDPRAVTERRRRFMVAGGAAIVAILGFGVAARGLRTKPAFIELEITPRGEIFVDGELKGESPPLKRLAVAPGAREIEVRNPPHAPLRLQTNLKPAEEMKVTHAFPVRKPAPRKEGDSFVEDLWRRLTR